MSHTCLLCNKTFASQQGCNYHTSNKVCTVSPKDRPPQPPKPTSCQRHASCKKGYKHQGNCAGIDPATGSSCPTAESLKTQFPPGWTFAKSAQGWLISAPGSKVVHKSIRAAKESLASPATKKTTKKAPPPAAPLVTGNRLTSTASYLATIATIAALTLSNASLHTRLQTCLAGNAALAAEIKTLQSAKRIKRH